MKKTVIAIIVASLGLQGCAYLNETKSVDVTGAFQLADRDAVENIDLGSLLCQYAPAGDLANCDPTGGKTPLVSSGDKSSSVAASQVVSIRFENALHYYNKQLVNANEKIMKNSRNGLQERLLTASVQRCNAYKGNLQRTFSRTNFGLGLTSTIAGTAGAIVNSAAAASAWSGISAISSGARAEFNQDFMSNLAAYVIVDGIDKRRQAIYEQIQTRGQAKSYEDYPVEAAIKDALYFHGQCSVIAGFQEASDAIKYANEPGVNTAINAYAKVQAMNSMAHSDEKSVEAILASASKITSTSALVAGSALEKNTDPVKKSEEVTAVEQKIQAVDDRLKKIEQDAVISDLKKNVADLKAKAEDALKAKVAAEAKLKTCTANLKKKIKEAEKAKPVTDKPSTTSPEIKK